MVFLALLLTGLFLSAFFSGSETGFYRVGRVRLALDARQGDPIAKALLWLTNNPSLFVATTLVGNNIANYATSLAFVLATRAIVGEGHSMTELLTPIAAAPFVFVYGELLPKNLFFMAPNRLLRFTAPLFLFFAVVFAPIAIVLWFLGWLLQCVVGQSHVQVRQRLARTELQRILSEGHDAGILGSTQTQLAQSIFEVSGQRIQRLATPVSRLVTVTDAFSRAAVVQAAKRHRAEEVIVRRQGADRGSNVLGYVRVADVLTNDQDWRDSTRKLIAIRHDESPLTAMVRMRSQGESLGEVVDASGRTTGLLAMERLIDSLLGEL